MDNLTKLHQEYLEKVMKELGADSASNLAGIIGVSPSTLNRFNKKGGQSTFSAHTLNKMFAKSGIIPPATTPGTVSEVDTKVLEEAINQILNQARELLIKDEDYPLSAKSAAIARLYNKKIKEKLGLNADIIEMDNNN